MTITDDGRGLADPAVLLTFGESHWEESIAKAEDPAGMGFLSLARLGCTIRWRTLKDDQTSARGYRLRLEPDHFLGRQPASTEQDDDAPRPHGTAVSFTVNEGQRHAQSTIEEAAQHYPLPVTVNDEAVKQTTFLDQAIHRERWRGLHFGVYRNDSRGYDSPDLNFHGLTLRVRLPDVSTIDGHSWSVGADIDSCPDLELVLPARKEAVETPFLQEMRDAARLAIYRAMQKADPPPRLGWKDWKRAADAGIDLAPPPVELRPWRPQPADWVDRWDSPPPYASVTTENPDSPSPRPLLVTADFNPGEDQAFYRAATRAGLANRLFAEDTRLDGLSWYDRMPRLTEVTTRVNLDGDTHSLEDLGDPGGDPVRPEAIHMDLHLSSPAADPKRAPRVETLTLAADLALIGEDGPWFQDVVAVVAAGAEVTPQELTTLLVDGFFSPSDDAEADAYPTQRKRYEAEAMHEATRVLVNSDEACKGLIADTVRRELYWICPNDREVDIHVRGTTIRVSLGALPSPSTS